MKNLLATLVVVGFICLLGTTLIAVLGGAMIGYSHQAAAFQSNYLFTC